MLKPVMYLLSKENALSALLVTLIVQLFMPALTMLRGGLLVGLIADVTFVLILLAALYTMTRNLLSRVFFSFLALLSTMAHTAWIGLGIRTLAGWDFIFTTLAVFGMLVVTLSMVYRDGPVTPHRIRGAIAAYLLIAVLYGKVYSLIYYLYPEAFNASAVAAGTLVQITRDFLYFSVVSLTTVGFGDITPVHPVARSLVMTEVFIGQLYPAVLLARLVSLSLSSKTER